MIDYVFLQNYWWFLIALLGGLLVFLLFVQGGNALIFLAGKSEDERELIINSTGRKWELTFTTLVTFGGAFFASFPLFYSTSFGGAYWVWILILITFVFQAVSYEFQGKAGNLLGKNAFRTFLTINGCLAPLLIGTAVGTFFTGSQFMVNKAAVGDIAAPVISRWANGWHGLEAVTAVREQDPDLVVLAFGMNDGTEKVDPEAFRHNIMGIKRSVLDRNPKAEFILISTTVANPESVFDGRQREYLPILTECMGQGDILVNMTEVHDHLLTRKHFVDMTGNNINHPNDFVHRMYAQTILTTLLGNEYYKK